MSSLMFVLLCTKTIGLLLYHLLRVDAGGPEVI